MSDTAHHVLKLELKGWGVTYTMLVEKLAALEGGGDSEGYIKNKLSRGKFTAAFMVECLEAVGSTTLELSVR